jgi:hypothetical protein
MLDILFQRSHHLRRLRANPLGIILEQFADYLLRPGYTAGFVHQLVRGAEHYGYYLGTRHPVVTADLVSRASAHQFLHKHLGTCSCPASFPRSLNPCRAAVRHPLRMSRSARSGSFAATRDAPRFTSGRVRLVPPADLRSLRTHMYLSTAERPRIPGAALWREPARP